MKLLVILASISSFMAFGATNEDLERKINILADEIAQLKASQSNIGTNQSAFGLGQAASKVYFINQGLSIGGYGEILYTNKAAEDEDGNATDREPTSEALRNVIYMGYKYNDKWLVNMELEIEHVNETFTEFMYVDYLASDELNYRFGLSLVPMGLVNELHEPIYFNSAKRSEIETYLIPSTWREIGVGAFGSKDKWSYKAFIFNGPDADGIAGGISNGIRKGRKKGGVEKNSSTAVAVVRADYQLDSANSFGGSIMQGSASSDNTSEDDPDMELRVAEFHSLVKKKGFGIKLLLSQVNFLNSDAWNEESTNKIPEVMAGGYLELEYDIELKKAAVLTPFVRFEKYDLNQKVDEDTYGSKDQSLEKTNTLVGFAYKPVDRVVFKADYAWKNNAAESAVNEFNLALGFLY